MPARYSLNTLNIYLLKKEIPDENFYFFLVLFCAIVMPTRGKVSPQFVESVQQNSVEMQAKRDAEADLNKLLWTGVGCGILWFPIALAGIGVAIGLAAGTQSYSGGDLLNDQSTCGACVGLTIGCLIPPISIYNYRPTPPPERLLGKSPEYIDVYTDAYKKRARQFQLTYSATGCAVGIGTYLIISVFANR